MWWVFRVTALFLFMLVLLEGVAYAEDNNRFLGARPASSPSKATVYGTCLKACDTAHVNAVKTCITNALDARAYLRSLQAAVSRPVTARNSTLTRIRSTQGRISASHQIATSGRCQVAASRAMQECKLQCKQHGKSSI